MAVQLEARTWQPGGQALRGFSASTQLAGGAGLSRQSHPPRGHQNRLRIIGGKWRGRKLDFPSVEGLRPTPDRVRETLFNWLQKDIQGARCLDLFAGSGALGLEALSRGASYSLLIDTHGEVVLQLKKHLETLLAPEGEVRQHDALQMLASAPDNAPFDIAFIDPPFGQELIVPCAESLQANGWLTENARVYIEAESTLKDLQLPPQWEILRQQSAGQVTSYLATCRPRSPES